MDAPLALFSLIAHLDVHLAEFARAHGALVYGLLFAIIFSETGFVVTPFLPGDSLLFVAGAVAAAGWMDVHTLALALTAAAFLGNSLNFQIGKWLGPRVARIKDSWYFKQEYLRRTREFYDRHGGKTIVISRFLPIFRTYAPFVAGVAAMPAGRFSWFNLLGAVLWITSLVYAGYWFGNIAWVKNNLTLVIIAIIILSLLPAIVHFLRARSAQA